jgi:hypothetical protein
MEHDGVEGEDGGQKVSEEETADVDAGMVTEGADRSLELAVLEAEESDEHGLSEESFSLLE